MNSTSSHQRQKSSEKVSTLSRLTTALASGGSEARAFKQKWLTPGGGASSQESSPTKELRASNGAIAVDLSAFRSSSFQASEFLQQQLLLNNTEDNLRLYFRQLQVARDEASVNIQRNVHRNYHEFILISKEISKLESDMLVVRELFTDLRGICEELLEEAGISAAVALSAPQRMERRGALTSVAAIGAATGVNLGSSQSMDSQESEMQGAPSFSLNDQPLTNDLPSLKENIDGLAKWIPSEEPRALLKESGQLVEVDSKDSRLAKNVFFFLLKDYLVVAQRKRKVYGKQKMTVDKVHSLADVSVMEMKDSPPEIVNSFRIVVHAEVWVYRAETVELKKSWVHAIKSVVEELSSKRKSRYAATLSSDNRPSVSIEEEPPVSSGFLNQMLDDIVATSHSHSHEKQIYRSMNILKAAKEDNTNPDLAWLKDMPDELDVYIAQREFDAAVQCVERAKTIFQQYASLESSNLSHLRALLDSRIQQLAKLISKDLANTTLPQSQIRFNIQKLSRLGMSEQARDIFLSARSTLIQQRVRQLVFEGDTTQYINDLSFVVFTLIKHSCVWYRASFKDARMASGFVRWLKHELEKYATIFRCQVFHDGQPFETIADCVACTEYHCQMLAAVGLDVGYIFDQSLFHRDIAQSIELYRTHLIGNISKAIADDEFTGLVASHSFETSTASSVTLGSPLSLKNTPASIPAYHVTPSCNHFYQTVYAFLADLTPLITNALYMETVESITNFFETYFRHMMDRSHDPQLSDKQQWLLLVNITFLAHHVFPCFRGVLASEKSQQSPSKVAASMSTGKLVNTMTRPIYRFGRPLPELDKLQTRLTAMRTIVFTLICQRRARLLAHRTFAFGKLEIRATPIAATASPPTARPRRMSVSVSNHEISVNREDYSSDVYPMLEQSFPSDTMLACIKELHGIARGVDEVLKEFAGVPAKLLPLDKTALLQGIIEAFFIDMMQESNWVDPNGNERVFGYSGVQQYVLDMHMFLKVCDAYLLPSVTKMANDACTRALKMYFKRAKDPSWILKNGDWYDKRVEETIKKGGPELKQFGLPAVATSKSTSSVSTR